MITQKEQHALIGSLLILVAVTCGLLIFAHVSPDQYGALTGKVTQTSVTMLPLASANCSLSLTAGWNLISVYCFQGDQNVTHAFDALGSSRYFIFAYAPNSNNSWLVDVKRVPSTVSDLPLYALSDLETVDRTHGYWIYTPSDVNFTYDGFMRPSVDTDLKPGWNLIGYPTNVSKNITDALLSIDGLYTAVLAYNASEGVWYYYTPSDPNSTLTVMQPYYGYWINMTTYATWTVNW